MVSLKRGIRSEEVRFKEQHVLFVEGKDKSSVDPKVLGEPLEEINKLKS